ncbi:hypothetical protein [uncultured Clostridium sp.]|uniref:hypothetical protein n=1 Tax=uncultured Clostridium sp. TaxID=59620 RepID=UPI002627A9B1|nr:hypothetical protein [uncultured Clostridium sp.]
MGMYNNYNCGCCGCYSCKYYLINGCVYSYEYNPCTCCYEYNFIGKVDPCKCKKRCCGCCN